MKKALTQNLLNYRKNKSRCNKIYLYKIVSRTKKIKKNKSNIKILILGIAYKKNLDDIRASAPVRLIDYLLDKKFKFVNYSDPFISSCEFTKIKIKIQLN